MASLHLSLNTHVQWESVCTELGIPFNSHALPYFTTCPLCRGDDFRIYWDQTSGGAWHYCRSCGSCGDMIELAAKAWNTTALVALKRLSAAGAVTAPETVTGEAVAAYVREYPDYRQRIDDLWGRARQSFRTCRCPDVAAIRRMHGLQFPNVSERRWAEGPSALIGALDHYTVERAFHPAAGDSDDRNRNASEHRVFHGGNWNGVLAAPFYDLPGRIRAFAFLGRQGRIPEDLVFRRLTQNPGGSSAAVAEAGLAGFESIEMAGNPGHVIAVNDWLLALKIQFRNLRTSMKAIPLVAWWDDGICRTTDAWQMLGPRQIIFWSFDLNPRVLMQAIHANGQISLAGPLQPTPETAAHYLRLHPGIDLERIICKKAKPWALALKHWIDRAEEGQVDDLILRLEQAGADVGYILRECDRMGLSPKLGRVARSIMFRGGIIRETPDGWVEERGRKKVVRNNVCNATLRITHLYKDRKTKAMFYRGEIRHKKECFPFVELADEVRENTAEWLEKFFAAQGLGVFTCRRNFRKHLHDIAISFHEPEFVAGDVWKKMEGMQKQQSDSGWSAGVVSNEVLLSLVR